MKLKQTIMKTFNRIKRAFTAKFPTTKDSLIIMGCTVFPIFVTYILIF